MMIYVQCWECHGYKGWEYDASDPEIKPCSCRNLAQDPRIFGKSMVGSEPVPVALEGPFKLHYCGHPIKRTPEEIGAFLGFNGVKSPFGLTRSFVIQSRRISEIMRAIIRYEDAGEMVPGEWVDELRGLLGKTEANK
jgi:hypothetical protein